MISQLKHILLRSRPRFWLYLAGPYFLGIVLGAHAKSEILNPIFLLFFLFFLFPANYFLYAINDLFDGDTDKFNEKKDSHEQSTPNQREENLIKYLSIATVLIAIGLLVLRLNVQVTLWMILFLLLSFFYSAPPIRFKATPILDSASNLLYAIPGFIGYIHASGVGPSLSVIILALFWTASMHLFSAIPDIEPDKKAGLKTTAVILGQKRSLIACLLLWSGFSFLAISTNILYLWIYLALIYPLIPLFLLMSGYSIKKFYWYFPFINTALGAIVTLGVLNQL